MKKPEVSILISAYNEEDYVERCIKSLLKQTYKDMEIVVIDDGSTDNTLEIVKKYPSVRIVKQNHLGLGASRNTGAKNAQGKMIIFADADLVYDKDYVRKLIAPIVKRESIGTCHMIEKVANIDNIWAKNWGVTRLPEKLPKKIGTFRAILKTKFLKVGGCPTDKGTFADVLLCQKIGFADGVEDAVCYHYNPTKLSEIFKHISWISSSFILNKRKIKVHIKRNIFKIFLGFLGLLILIAITILIKLYVLFIILFVIIGYGLFKSIKYKDMRMLYAAPIFRIVWFAGFGYGMLRQIIKKIKGEKIENY